MKICTKFHSNSILCQYLVLPVPRFKDMLRGSCSTDIQIFDSLPIVAFLMCLLILVSSERYAIKRCPHWISHILDCLVKVCNLTCTGYASDVKLFKLITVLEESIYINPRNDVCDSGGFSLQNI